VKKIILLFSICLISASSAFAGKPYGRAGCGWGSQVYTNDENQVLAATTNSTFYNQMFAITFGTSNCAEDGTLKVAQQIPVFIESNRVSLANDIARGSGETVSSLSKMLGCDDNNYFASTLQKRYETIFPDHTVSDSNVTDSIYSVIEEDEKLSQACTVKT
jgi:hypothetical protein